jgi:hypothetical protein
MKVILYIKNDIYGLFNMTSTPQNLWTKMLKMKKIPNLLLLVGRDHQLVYFTMFSPFMRICNYVWIKIHSCIFQYQHLSRSSHYCNLWSPIFIFNNFFIYTSRINIKSPIISPIFVLGDLNVDVLPKKIQK